MKKVIIVRGIPGSGKTRYVEALADKNEQVVVCSADHYFEKFVRGMLASEGERVDYEFDPKKLPEAHNACLGTFLDALLMGYAIVVLDNTNIRRWEYSNYEKAARLAGYEVEIVEFRASTVDEIRLCADRNKHGVPRDIIARMAVDFEVDTRAAVVPVLGKR